MEHGRSAQCWYMWLMQESKLGKAAHVTFRPEGKILDIMRELETIDLDDEIGDDAPTVGPPMEAPNAAGPELQHPQPPTTPTKRLSRKIVGVDRADPHSVPGSTKWVNRSVRQMGATPTQANL